MTNVSRRSSAAFAGIRWTALALLALAPLARAQIVVTALPNTTANYLYYPLNSPPETDVNVSGTGTYPGGSVVVINLSYSSFSSGTVQAPAVACGAGCVEQALNGSGTFSLNSSPINALISGTLSNGEIFAAAGTSQAVVQFTLTTPVGTEFLILQGATASPIGLCATQVGPCNSPGSSPAYLNSFSLTGPWTETFSATAYAGTGPAPARQLYLNAANLGGSVSWSSPTNPWQLGSTTSGNPAPPPMAGDDVFVVNTTASSGATTVQYDAALDPQLHSLTINSTGGATGHSVTLAQASGTLTSASETIGTNGAAAHVQTGGTNNVTGSLTIQSFGTYLLTGGSLNAGSVLVDGGAFTMQGGSLNYSSLFVRSGGVLTSSLQSAINNVGSGASVLVQGGGTIVNGGINPSCSGTCTALFTSGGGAGVTVDGAGSTFNNFQSAQFVNGTSAGGATLTLSNGGQFLNGSPDAGVQFTNQNGSVVAVTGSGTDSTGNVVYSTFRNAYTNGVLNGSQAGGAATMMIDNGGQLVNGGYFVNQYGSTLTVGSAKGAGTLANNTFGNLINNGAGTTLSVQNGSTLTNSGALLTNNAGAQLVITGAGSTLVNIQAGLLASTITNDGAGTTLTIASGATFNNSANFINQNLATFSNSGTFNNLVGGSLQNDAIVINSGAFNVNAGSTMQGAGFYSQHAGSTQIDGSFSQFGLIVQAGTFDVTGQATVAADAANAGSISIGGAPAALTVGGRFTNSGSVLLAGGTLTGSAGIVNTAGVIGGTGSLIGPVTISGGIVHVGASPDALKVHGSYSQTGGAIDFEVDPNGTGGFLESTLVFDPANSVSISGTDIVFDFKNGADPLAFLNSGQFNLDTFFMESDGSAFALGNLQSDLFQYEIGSGPLVDLSYDAATGDLTAANNVPEPSTVSLLLPGIGMIGFSLYRRRRPAAVGAKAA